MWKPFLARSLCSVFGGSRRHAVPPGGADPIFSRAYACWKPEAGGGQGTSRSNCHHQQPILLPQRRHHLYVVLRDSKREHDVYTFHKLSLDDDALELEDMNGSASVGNGTDGARNLRRLPEPIARIGTGGVGKDARFHALGSNIFVTGTGDNSNGLTLLYNTDREELDVGGDLPGELIGPYDAVAAGGKLHALQAPQYLCGEPPEHWNWDYAVRSRAPRFTGGVGARVTAHALHPDGRTVFVSVHHLNQQDKAHETFSLDTERGDWTHRGNWSLPFHGHGHYDGDLEGWVGVARSTDECDYYYLCSCDVPAVAADSSTPPPAWKLGEEKLTFIEEAPVSTMGRAPVLVHTGHGRFCLVETASLAERVTPGRRCSCDASADDDDSFIQQLHVTMFRAKYRKNGELVVAAAPQAARSYEIPSGTSFDGPAFWM